MKKTLLIVTGAVLAGVVVIGVSACSRSNDAMGTRAARTHDVEARPAITVEADKPVDLPGLHNVVAYAPGTYSGSVPEGAEGFETLRAMGVKTIISVDGAQPDVDAANKLGLRYVHLPIGYNGMDEPRTLEIARAIRDLPGPVYLHCHHGKHRSAGALGAAVVTLGLSTNEQATQRMKVSGAAPNYTGLYQCVTVASVATPAQLDAADNTFPQRWRTTGFVKSMVEVDEVYEYLKLIEKAGWQAPADHPDLVPVAEAGRLADLFRNCLDDQVVKNKPAEMHEWMLKASRECEDLERGLAEPGADSAQLSERFAVITRSCRQCHVRYRDE